MVSRPSDKSLLGMFDEAKELQEKGQWGDALKKYRIVLHWYPEAPEVWLLMGRARLMKGESEEGIRCLRMCVRLQPDYVEGWNDLGRALLECEDMIGATQALGEALRLSPLHPTVLLNMARTIRGCGNADHALDYFEQACEADPVDAVCCAEAGSMLFYAGRMDEAKTWFEKALERDPSNGTTYRHLGAIFYQEQRIDDALLLFNRWAEVDPTNATARHMIAACGGAAAPDRAAPEHVAQIFDRFAASFEECLGRLEYRAPELVVALLDGVWEGGAVLDAGCGTGWCGPLLRPRAQRLVGVDISQGMLDVAARKKCYDELILADLLDWSPGEALFDVVVSSDTLNYFGDLSGPLATFARVLKPFGLLAFTLECGGEAGPPVVLQPHGRYAHQYTFMIDTLTHAGFSVEVYRTDVLRHEAGAEVRGHIVLARRGSDSTVSLSSTSP